MNSQHEKVKLTTKFHENVMLLVSVVNQLTCDGSGCDGSGGPAHDFFHSPLVSDPKRVPCSFDSYLPEATVCIPPASDRRTSIWCNTDRRTSGQGRPPSAAVKGMSGPLKTKQGVTVSCPLPMSGVPLLSPWQLMPASIIPLAMITES